MKRSILTAVLLLVCTGTASADKSQYHLLSPVPRDLMRELSTDRPDTTESPYTVDAGHVQAEMSFIDYTRESEDGETVETFRVLPMNLKAGLLNHVDLQLVFDAYVEEETAFGGDSDTASGFSDTQLRLKINFWGNDGGRTAFAFMPFVQFPTAGDDLGNDHLEGGLIFPFAVELTEETGLGLMAEIDFVRNEEDTDYEVDLVHTAVFGLTIAGELGGYLEYVGVFPGESGVDYIVMPGAGLTYGLTPDIQLDAGVGVGLTDDADDFNIFTGISVRS